MVNMQVAVNKYSHVWEHNRFFSIFVIDYLV